MGETASRHLPPMDGNESAAVGGWIMGMMAWKARKGSYAGMDGGMEGKRRRSSWQEKAMMRWQSTHFIRCLNPSYLSTCVDRFSRSMSVIAIWMRFWFLWSRLNLGLNTQPGFAS